MMMMMMMMMEVMMKNLKNAALAQPHGKLQMGQ